MHLVILGNGAAAISAVRTIRKKDKGMQISLVFKENVPYYSPAVLPYYVEGKISRQSLFPEGWDFYKENRIEIVAGKRVNTLIAKEKKVKLDDNSEIFYDKLFFATGAFPFLLALVGIMIKLGNYFFFELKDINFEFLEASTILRKCGKDLVG